MLATAKLRTDGTDPMATPANILKLFQVSQLVMELQHIYVEEDSIKIQEQETELKRLEQVANDRMGRNGMRGESLPDG